MANFMDRNPAFKVLIDRSTVNVVEIAAAFRTLLNVFVDLNARMPSAHAWKDRKLQHCLSCAKEIEAVVDLLGLRDSRDLWVIAFAAGLHDFGRLKQVVEPREGQKPVEHGRDGAELIREQLHFVRGHESELWQVILAAIEQHSMVKNPTVEDLRVLYPLLDEVAIAALAALIGIVRDIDRVSGFKDAIRYTREKEFKRKQIAANWPKQRAIDPTFGEEKGQIEPEGLLEIFLAGEAIVRDLCASYEAYMLQFLGWLLQLQNPEAIFLALATGGPQIVLRYILGRLRKRRRWDQYQRLLKWAKAWQGGALLRAA